MLAGRPTVLDIYSMASTTDHVNSRGYTVVGVCVAFTALSLLFTISRLLTRCLITRITGVEEYFITLAAVSSIVLTALIGTQVKYGMGRHIDTLTPEDFRLSVRPFWASIFVYAMAITFTKVSILLQYRRVLIFPKTIRAIWIMMGIVVAYGIATVLDSIFICSPVEYFWNKDIKGGTCLDRTVVWFCNASFNIAIDLAIVILPMPAIKSLHLPKKQKIGIICLFALGGFVCITSIIRLYSLYVISVSTDVTWDNVGAATWSSVETNVGIICACLPASRSLFTYIKGRRRAAARRREGLKSDSTSLPKDAETQRHTNTLASHDSKNSYGQSYVLGTFERLDSEES